FAGYGFNRSHAACYAMIGYQTAYLKAHWPVEFMAALLTSVQGDSDRVAIEIEECRNMGIKIMAPDVNESFGTFTVVTAGTKENKIVAADEKVDTIRFGLKAIKNVGEHIVDALIKERKENGAYQEIFALLERVTDKDLNKKSLESLIKSGAMEGFGERGFLLANLEKFLSFNKEESKNKDSRQESLFGDLPGAIKSHPNLNDSPPAAQNEKLIWEKELLGLYVSEHPFNFFKPYLAGYALSIASLSGHKNDDRIITAGVIASIKKIITRKGESMIFVKIEDATSSTEILVFPRLYKETIELWEEGRTIIIDGKASEKDSDLKILANRARILDINDPQKSIDDFKRLMMESPAPIGNRYRNGNNGGAGGHAGYKSPYAGQAAASASSKKTLKAQVDSEKPVFLPASSSSLRLIISRDPSLEDLSELKKIFAVYAGEDEVYFRIIEAEKFKVIKTAFRIANNDALRQELEKKLAAVFKISQ
ncbi:MAG: OB-fold nucleic acid binding domain-containing protein, partial [Patescibacteria group bacterium]